MNNLPPIPKMDWQQTQPEERSIVAPGCRLWTITVRWRLIVFRISLHLWRTRETGYQKNERERERKIAYSSISISWRHHRVLKVQGGAIWHVQLQLQQIARAEPNGAGRIAEHARHPRIVSHRPGVLVSHEGDRRRGHLDLLHVRPRWRRIEHQQTRTARSVLQLHFFFLRQLLRSARTNWAWPSWISVDTTKNTGMKSKSSSRQSRKRSRHRGCWPWHEDPVLLLLIERASRQCL